MSPIEEPKDSTSTFTPPIHPPELSEPIQLPELSEWTLLICGASGLRVTPLKGQEPGPVRRWLCKFLTGFEWKRNC